MDVRLLYQTYIKNGLIPKEAAKKAQSETGMSIVTGQEIKQKKLIFSKKGVKYGEYPIL